MVHRVVLVEATLAPRRSDSSDEVGPRARKMCALHDLKEINGNLPFKVAEALPLIIIERD
jgi:hypothetical protein